ncbi:hypothetical protein [Crystallibacter degradans]|uniref:hypothetical protein n=1 Tax=Crystallibacter degradans TaxID=2726743 RepID=UPI0014744AA0|nr:hypothetical protein [Arthrobacter sp. SF27]NMR32330.1 hypothetical protein [Arthrobacter sp. SF27]
MAIGTQQKRDTMIVVEPEYMSLSYRLKYQGVPDHRGYPETYPLTWQIDISADVFEDDEGDGEEHSIGSAVAHTVPDAGLINLFDTLDAVDQELASFGEVLGIMRPDVLEEAGMTVFGGDLLILSNVEIKPDYQGQKLGHHVLHAVLETIGRNTDLVVLRAAPLLEDDAPDELPPEHEAAKAALRSYWESFGFIPVLKDDHGDYLVYFVGRDDDHDAGDSLPL